MLIESPVSLSDAVKVLLAKELMPTSLDSAGIRQLDAALRRQSLFSAQTTSEYLLGKYRDRIASILNPGIEVPGGSRPAYNEAYTREEIKRFLREMGYRPAQDERGTIKDLSADARINLVIETNRDMAEGQGWWLEGQSRPILDQWPAQELFRAEARKVPRDWMQRWQLAGGQTDDPIGTGWTITPEGRLIALKNHDIWEQLGSSENFPDGLDQPWPPFAFQSGMWVRDVDRTTAEALGLIEAGESVEPMTLEEVAA